jgi:hypothetical protein
MSVADRMEFGIQSALCPAYETRGAPFLRRLAAGRWALR